MTGMSMIGDVKVQFRDQDGRLYKIETSDERETIKVTPKESEVIEGHEVPTWIELTTSDGVDPNMHVRIELRDGAPHVVDLRWASQPHQSAIRQKHLRQIDLAKLATDLVASTISTGPSGGDTTVNEQVARIRRSKELESETGCADYVNESVATLRAAKKESESAKRVARKFVERQRRPREYRVITDNFLNSVTEVYRENIGSAPTKAVATAFNVKERMASTYVQRARAAGFLPSTKRGQKKM